MARLVTEARQQPLRWWAGYALYAAAVVGVAWLWRPHLLPFGIAMVVVNLVVTLGVPAFLPGRHRHKQPGTQHLAE